VVASGSALEVGDLPLAEHEPNDVDGCGGFKSACLALRIRKRVSWRLATAFSSIETTADEQRAFSGPEQLTTPACENCWRHSENRVQNSKTTPAGSPQAPPNHRPTKFKIETHGTKLRACSSRRSAGTCTGIGLHGVVQHSGTGAGRALGIWRVGSSFMYCRRVLQYHQSRTGIEVK
jgi:hypothetical protein